MLRKSLTALFVTALMTSAALAESNRTTGVELLNDVKASAELDLTADLIDSTGEIDADVFSVFGSEEKPVDAVVLRSGHRGHRGHGNRNYGHYGKRHYGYGHYGHRRYGHYGHGYYGYGYRNYGYRHYGHYNYGRRW